MEEVGAPMWMVYSSSCGLREIKVEALAFEGRAGCSETVPIPTLSFHSSTLIFFQIAS